MVVLGECRTMASERVCLSSLAEMGYSVANVSEGTCGYEVVRAKVVVGVLFRRAKFWNGGLPFKWEGEAKPGVLFGKKPQVGSANAGRPSQGLI